MMTGLTVALAFVKGGLGGLWEFFSSHFGQLVVVGLVAWFWAGHRANIRCEARQVAQQAAAIAAAQAESARQADAAREIAEAATNRLVEEQLLAKDLQAQIAAFDKDEDHVDAPPRDKPSCTPVVVRPCRVDDVFSRRVRSIDAGARHRAAGPARGSR